MIFYLRSSMMMPEQSQIPSQQPQTVDLSVVNASQNAPAQEGFFDKQLKNLAGFIAKMTGQPDPISGAVPSQTFTSSPQPQMTNSSDTQIPQTSDQQATQTPVKTPSFFDTLVASTQGLLNKTQQVANTIVTKTTDFTNTVVNTTQSVSNKIVTTATDASQMITNAPTKLAEGIQGVADKAQNLTTEVVQKTKEIGSDPSKLLQEAKSAGQNLINDPLTSVQQASSQIINTAQDLGTQTLQAGEQLVTPQGDHTQSSDGSFIQKLNQGVDSLVNKGKEIGTSVVDQTKSFVENPTAQLDSLVGGGVESQPVQTETEHTTSLDTLTQQTPPASQA